jgi:lambda family phage portal protein
MNVLIRGADTGYAQAGASLRKRALKGFDARSYSAQEDIDASAATLRQRSRLLFMAAPLATSAVRTNRTNVIGCGLRLKSRLVRDVLGIDGEAAAAAEQHIEREFGLWASDKRACDSTGINDLYSIQQLAFQSWLLSGDSFILFKEGVPDAMRPYTLRLHVIEADRISTPNTLTGTTKAWVDGLPLTLGIPTEGMAANGNLVHDGVEVDKNGAACAYHISTAYPDGTLLQANTWQRVEAYGLTGLPNIIQIMDSERPDQYRGVPYLAHVIEPLLQLRRYTDSEIMAAVVESFFTAFIKTEASAQQMPFNEVGPPISSDPDDFEMGPGTVNVMQPGEDVVFADPKRPATSFNTFVDAVATQIGAALEVPGDLLLKAFNSSYSASRAALLEAWKAFKMRREWFVSDFCQPVYEVWFTEAAARGRIDAPGFFDDPLVRAAWLGAEWIGPSQGQIDPVKEIEAELKAIGHGITTHEQATVRLNGGSWDSNIEQLANENERLSKANKYILSGENTFDIEESSIEGGASNDDEEKSETGDRQEP